MNQLKIIITMIIILLITWRKLITWNCKVIQREFKLAVEKLCKEIILREITYQKKFQLLVSYLVDH